MGHWILRVGVAAAEVLGVSSSSSVLQVWESVLARGKPHLQLSGGCLLCPPCWVPVVRVLRISQVSELRVPQMRGNNRWGKWVEEKNMYSEGKRKRGI